ncbi:hypothetical protein CYMTET_39044 [Cymbomonas tetramitiformis]|uniref:DRBM domain-containing protein n=1 Tax=Cymbomonas tetramitiformis TaxID=36881 RepID=A0AAE0CCX1_9CHLO|nr:hypothetical protein CYMTET_39044 [Cymbomonas tetramitiformis]
MELILPNNLTFMSEFFDNKKDARKHAAHLACQALNIVAEAPQLGEPGAASPHVGAASAALPEGLGKMPAAPAPRLIPTSLSVISAPEETKLPAQPTTEAVHLVAESPEQTWRLGGDSNTERWMNQSHNNRMEVPGMPVPHKMVGHVQTKRCSGETLESAGSPGVVDTSASGAASDRLKRRRINHEAPPAAGTPADPDENIMFADLHDDLMALNPASRAKLLVEATKRNAARQKLEALTPQQLHMVARMHRQPAEAPAGPTGSEPAARMPTADAVVMPAGGSRSALPEPLQMSSSGPSTMKHVLERASRTHQGGLPASRPANCSVPLQQHPTGAQDKAATSSICPKTRLNEVKGAKPIYSTRTLTQASAQQICVLFESEVTVFGQTFTSPEPCARRKDAEKSAARCAIDALGL